MRQITASFEDVRGQHDKYFRQCVGSGHAYLGLRADWQRHLAAVRNECGFKYLRFHGLLHDDMGIYREDKEGNPIYNWQYVDALYDYILSIGMKPFVELGFMPKALASGDQTMFFWQANVTPPKSYAKWEDLIRALVQHFTERYGEEEVKTWYFEVWNEPNLGGFFSGDMEEYFTMYQVTSKAVKSVCEDYKVGGPSTAGPKWISELIRFCTDNNVSVDFITTHDYGVEGALDEFGTKRKWLKNDPNAIIDAVEYTYNRVKESELPELEIHYTEWSTSYSHRDAVHDSYISAPYILSKLRRLEGMTNSMSYWAFSDVFEEGGPGPDHFHGGFGLVNLQGLKKPSFYAYKFLNELGEKELECNDPDAWICRGESDIQALFWDLTQYEQDVPNEFFYKRDLPPAEIGSVGLEITDITPGEYQLQVYQVGYGVNDVYTAYLGFSHSGTLSPKQVAELETYADGKPVSTEKIEIGQNGVFRKEFEMRQNDVFLIKLVKSYS